MITDNGSGQMGSRGGSSERCRNRGREVKVDALCAEERAYLLGLYFADGYLERHSKSVYRVRFCLQGDELEIAERVAEMLGRAGLIPHIWKDRRFDAWIVSADALNLPALFPGKERFLSLSGAKVRRWAKREGLDGKPGVSFTAGLLDGDGSVRARRRREGVFGCVTTNWEFAQVKYLFIVEFLSWYLERLAPDGAHVIHCKNGTWDVYIRTSGRDALMDAGIAEWSWKVARYLRNAEEMRREIQSLRSRFCNVSEAARRLHISATVVKKWCKRGTVKRIRIRGLRSFTGKGYFLIPVEEVDRLMAERGGGAT